MKSFLTAFCAAVLVHPVVGQQENYKDELKVETGEGQGSTFTIQIPKL